MSNGDIARPWMKKHGHDIEKTILTCYDCTSNRASSSEVHTAAGAEGGL